MFNTDTTIFVDQDLVHEVVDRLVDGKLHSIIISSDAIGCELLNEYETPIDKLKNYQAALREIRKIRAGEKSDIAERIDIKGGNL